MGAIYIVYEFHQSKQLLLVQHIIFSIASAVAMSFAIIATMLSLYLYDQRSLGWCFMAIIAYVFKDSIKKWFHIIDTNKILTEITMRRSHTLTSDHTIL